MKANTRARWALFGIVLLVATAAAFSVHTMVSVEDAQTITGAKTFKSYNNIRVVDPANGGGWCGGSTDVGVCINNALASKTEILVMSTGTLSTQVAIHNLSHVRIRGVGTFAATVITNGLVGGQPAFKIDGTSTYIDIGYLQILGNGLTGASGNGHAISVVGTGATPSNVYVHDCYINLHKGNALDGTGAAMNGEASAVYVYDAINTTIERNSIQANQAGIWDEVTGNNLFVHSNTINGNLLYGVRATSMTTLHVSDNDIEQNGSGSGTQGGVYFDFVNQAEIGPNNHNEANSPFDVYNNGSIGYSWGVNIHDNYTARSFGNSAIVISASAVKPVIDNNVIAYSVSNVGSAISIADGTVAPSITNNSIRTTTSTTLAAGILLNGTTTGVSGAVIRGNQCGSLQASVDGTITKCIDVENPASNTRIENNSCYANTGGTITTCLYAASSSTYAVFSGNVFTTTNSGTITNQISDNGTASTFFRLGGLQPGSTTVGALPAASTYPGMIMLVTDSTAVSAEGQTCVGSSTNKALAVSNGTAWKCF